MAGETRVDRFWAGVFGEVPGPPPESVVVGHREALAGYPGIFCVIRNGVVLVSAPPDLVPAVRSWNPAIATAGDAGWWQQRRPDWTVLGPSVHAFTVRTAEPPSAVAGIEVRPANPAELDELRDAVTPAEWAESGFAGDDITSAWAAVDHAGRVLAAANLTPFDGVPADVGVLTAPTARDPGHQRRGRAARHRSLASAHDQHPVTPDRATTRFRRRLPTAGPAALAQATLEPAGMEERSFTVTRKPR